MTDEEIAELWRMHGPLTVMSAAPGTKVHDFAIALIAAERERCAEIVRGLFIDGPTTTELVAGANIALGEALRKIERD